MTLGDTSGQAKNLTSSLIEPRRPLVVGAPRSGSSLLIQVINSLLRMNSRETTVSLRQRVMSRLVEISSFYMTQRYRQTFARFGIERDLVFNGEFHLIIGGPKWLEKNDPSRACIRKYFGVRAMGDFLLVNSHPREVLEYNSVIHSHTSPALWLREAYYRSCPKFTSVRNPIGIINSACFSLNAMASEYIQKFMAHETEEFIRQRHGLYKLTDLEFVRGLISFLKAYLDEYLSVCESYFAMKWEDLIEHPTETIKRIASALEISCTDDQARGIWSPIDHVNFLQFHKHNYRRGKGIVGDWKNSLVSEHMDLFREYGFDHYLEALGYPPIPDLNPREYSSFQRLVSRYLSRGEVYRNIGDPTLFGFAFNKSNIDAGKFNFKSFPKRKWTHVERSTFVRDDVVEAISDTSEDGCEKINEIFGVFLSETTERQFVAQDLLRWLKQRCMDLMADIDNPEGICLCENTFRD